VEREVAVVLIVEDEALIRINAVDFVERAGHVAIEAASADEAIKILETRKDVDIVFSDVTMPGSMDGLKLISIIRNRWPPIELILTSGKGLPMGTLLPKNTAFLQKPYGFQGLEQAIAQRS